MEPIEVIDYPEGWKVEIHQDDVSRDSPLAEYDGQPKLILHAKAERHFGWTTDLEIAALLDTALDRGRISRDHALTVFCRWVRAYYDVAAILPVSAIEHSGVMVYLGSSNHWSDPGGWDSGWVGFCLVTKTQWREWQMLNPDDPIDTESVEEAIEGSFKEFADWVSGSVYGYIVRGPDGEEAPDGSCWGYYGSETWDERVLTKMVLGQRPIPGWVIRDSRFNEDFTIYTVEDTETEGKWHVQYNGAAAAGWLSRGDTITLVHKGHMRDEFESVIEYERGKIHAERAAMFKRLVDPR